MLYDEITRWAAEGSPVDIIYLDFQKALDKLHQRLILKLKSYGLGIIIINWITERRQRALVVGEVSNWKSLLSGVDHSTRKDDEGDVTVDGSTRSRSEDG